MSENARTKPLMTKAALMSRIECAFDAFQRVVETYSAEAMTQPLKHGGWSIKDTLAHLAGWETILLKFHLGGESFDQVIGLKGAEYRIISFDTVNDHLHERYQGLSAEQAHQFLRDTHIRLMSELENFPEDQLHQPHPGLSIGEYASLNWIDYVAANTYEHFEEHLATFDSALG